MLAPSQAALCQRHCAEALALTSPCPAIPVFLNRLRGSSPIDVEQLSEELDDLAHYERVQAEVLAVQIYTHLLLLQLPTSSGLIRVQHETKVSK